ncbi:MAG TPA: RDD family protein, partial [Polyangiaceae bacterium]
MRTLDTAIDVETPERVRFSFRLAGPAQRAAAYLVDAIVRGVVLAVVWLVAGLFGAIGGIEGLGMGIALFALFAVEWGYYVACERLMNGRSIGKQVLHLRVVRSDGLPIGFA